MSTDSGIRASQQDREDAAELLRQAFTAGRLDLPELRERSGAAYAAATWGELRRLTADLPGESPGKQPPARRRPFAPLLITAVLWLAIAALAHAPQALALPLMLLATWSLCIAARPLPGPGDAARQQLGPPAARDRPDAPRPGAPRPGTGRAGSGECPASRARRCRPAARPGHCTGRRKQMPRSASSSPQPGEPDVTGGEP